MVEISSPIEALEVHISGELKRLMESVEKLGSRIQELENSARQKDSELSRLERVIERLELDLLRLLKN